MNKNKILNYILHVINEIIVNHNVDNGSTYYENIYNLINSLQLNTMEPLQQKSILSYYFSEIKKTITKHIQTVNNELNSNLDLDLETYDKNWYEINNHIKILNNILKFLNYKTKQYLGQDFTNKNNVIIYFFELWEDLIIKNNYKKISTI